MNSNSHGLDLRNSKKTNPIISTAEDGNVDIFERDSLGCTHLGILRNGVWFSFAQCVDQCVYGFA